MCQRMVSLMMVGALLVGLLVGSVQAANIAWDGPYTSTSPEDVVADGETVEAFNMYVPGSAANVATVDPVVNGIQFTGNNEMLGNAYTVSQTFFSGSTGDDAYDDLLNTCDFGGGGDYFTRDLGGENLQVGKQYLIQVWYVDTRGPQAGRVMQYGDGNGNTVDLTAGEAHYAIGTFTADGTTQTLSFDAQGFGNAHLTAYQIRTVAAKTVASNPQPVNAAPDVLRDGTVLEWTAGEFATSHDVYLGTSFEDVNTATTYNPEFKGNQAETAYALDRLEFGVTYFWRIDEVNDAHPDSPWQGAVWQFEAEPEGILVDLLTATASSQNSADEDPNNTINGVGLNEDGSHSQDKKTMWLSAVSDPGTAWIRYDLSTPQKLSEMLVWNHNTQSEEDLGYGIKDALIEVSEDGINFTSLGTVQLLQAAETSVDMQALFVQSVKITAQNNWGGLISKFGVSAVRLYAIPNAAREMSPAEGAANVDPTTAVLTWRGGREATVHELYLSTDEQAVIDGTAPMVPVTDVSYVPALELEKTYYWRVDEVNDLEVPALWAGSVQSFSTLNSIVVDDMESYEVDMWKTWSDGYDDPANGALVGNGFLGEPETEIVYEGSQSMPMAYGDGGIQNSWSTRTFETPPDWSQYGIKSLSLYVHGSADNVGGQLYVKINDTQFDYQGAATDIQAPQWFPWTVDLTGVTTVTSLTIGVTGGSGTIYVDNIRLYPLASELLTPVLPDAANLQALYDFAGNLNDGSGNGHNGTAIGGASVVTDPARGQVVSLNGFDDGVAIPLIGSYPEATISLWINMSTELPTGIYGSLFHDDGFEPNDVHWRVQNGTLNGGINGGIAGSTGRMAILPNTWIHVALMASEAGVSFWINGLEDMSSTLATPVVNLGEGSLGAWLDTRADPAVLDRTFPGLLDEVRFYDRTLTPAELAGLAERSAPLYKAFPQ
ncbi:LamG-like jellyroll fold domain-containing protein [Planctomycetota bacterium]